MFFASDCRTELCRITVPPLVAGVLQDCCLPHESSIEVVRQIPNAELMLFPHKGRVQDMEMPGTEQDWLEQVYQQPGAV